MHHFLLKNGIVCIGWKAEEKLILGYRLFSFSFQELRSRKVKQPLDEDFWLCFCSFNQAVFPSHLCPSGPSWKSLSFVLNCLLHLCSLAVLVRFSLVTLVDLLTKSVFAQPKFNIQLVLFQLLIYFVWCNQCIRYLMEMEGYCSEVLGSDGLVDF